jgi:hypothetical protein
MRFCVFIALVSVLWVGCQSQPTGTRTVAVGMPLHEAGHILEAAQAKDITMNVGIITGGLRPADAPIEDWTDHWYVLSDNTCLHLTSGRLPDHTTSTIQSITLGERGRGYPDKVDWMKQKHAEMQRLQL